VKEPIVKIAISFFFALLAIALVASATIIHVPSQYATIQGGINAAANGDTVLVAPGTYTGQVTIQNTTIKLLSSGGADVTVINNNGATCLRVSTSSEISGFNLRLIGYMSSYPAVEILSGSPFIHHNVIYTGSEGPIGVGISGGSPLCLNNTIWIVDDLADFMYAFHVTSATAAPTIKNNIVKEDPHWSSISYGIYNQGGANINHSYNDFFQCTLQGTPAGVGEISANPLWGTNNYHLLAGSPCIDTGVPLILDPDSTRSDMGCFYYPQTIAPVITSIPDTMVYAGYEYLYQLTYIGSPAPTFLLLTAPVGMTVNNTGLIQWSVPETYQGDTVISVQAANVHGTFTQAYTLHVLPFTLLPPQIISYSPAALDSITPYGQVVPASVQAMDPNQLPLEYLWKLNGVVVSQDSSCQIIFNQVGSITLRAYVSNGYLLDSTSWNTFVPGTSVSGNVFGIWSPTNNPYVATGTLSVPNDQFLTIFPGTILYLGSGEALNVYGTIQAQGALGDSIYFRNDGPVTFSGVNLMNTASASSVLSYCVLDSATTCFSGNACDLAKIEHSRLRGGTGISTGCDCTLVYACDIQAGMFGVSIHNTQYSHLRGNVIRSSWEGVSYWPGWQQHCKVDSNWIYSSSAGIELYEVLDVSLSRNQIESGGDGIYIGEMVGTVDNNSIRLLANGAAFKAVYHSTVSIVNNIAYALSGGTGVWREIDAFVTQVQYNDFYGFDSLYHNVQAGPGNLALNPQFVGGHPFSYQLQATSPCIDTGDPLSPLDPDGTRADMGAFYFPHTATPPQFDITLTSVSPPIVIPAQGGSFNFNINVINHGPNPTAFALWARMKKPNGLLTPPTLGPVTINPPVGAVITRQRTQNIAANYPPGLYDYIGYTALVYPGPVVDSSYFTFTKSAAAGIGPIVENDLCTGDPFPYEVAGETTLPSAFALSGASPNPFNPTTDIRYQMPDARNISLRVYDTAGRLVATLVDGWREAGTHEVTFDGSAMASGLYFVRMQGGDFSGVEKIMLIK
jgi:hypothetical protein